MRVVLALAAACTAEVGYPLPGDGDGGYARLHGDPAEGGVGNGGEGEGEGEGEPADAGPDAMPCALTCQQRGLWCDYTDTATGEVDVGHPVDCCGPTGTGGSGVCACDCLRRGPDVIGSYHDLDPSECAQTCEQQGDFCHACNQPSCPPGLCMEDDCRDYVDDCCGAYLCQCWIIANGGEWGCGAD